MIVEHAVMGDVVDLFICDMDQFVSVFHVKVIFRDFVILVVD